MSSRDSTDSRPGAISVAGTGIEATWFWPHVATAEKLAAGVRSQIGLLSILVLALALNFYRLGETGYGNLFYAGSVRSMSMSWSNFFFVAFDPTGHVSIDKPPVGFWMQTLSVKIFGFSGPSLLLPQALAGAASVAMVYVLVRRLWNQQAGLIAALMLALSPINVAANRNNTVDAQLAFVLLLAAWAVLKASEEASRRWLVAGFVLVGIGFNIKMLQAYIILPALVALFFVTAPARWPRKLADLCFAGLALAVTSFAWVIAVDLTPVASRPYVGASDNNRVSNLIFGHNGGARLVGSPGQIQGQDIGSPGLFRFVDQHFASQVGWLLPLALVGIVILAAGRPWRKRKNWTGRERAFFLWGVWFMTMLALFSAITFFHLYYLVIMTPAIAALAGIALDSVWKALASGGSKTLMAVAVVAGALLFQLHIATIDPFWLEWLAPAMFGLLALAAIAWLVHRYTDSWSLRTAAATLGLLSLLVGPASWSALTVWIAPGTTVPLAGPLAATDSRSVSEVELRIDPKAIGFLRANRGDARYLVGTLTSFHAAPLIVTTGEAVLNVGGYKGRDATLSTTELAQLIEIGAVRFFVMPHDHLTPAGRETFAADLIADQVWKTCALVPADNWKDRASPASAWDHLDLYDCAPDASLRVSRQLKPE